MGEIELVFSLIRSHLVVIIYSDGSFGVRNLDDNPGDVLDFMIDKDTTITTALIYQKNNKNERN